MAKRVLLTVQQLRRTIGLLAGHADRSEHVVISKHGQPFGTFVPIGWYRDAAKKMGDPTEY
jgi:hypothetical protein